MQRIMSRPGMFVCKLLVLLYLCAVSSATERSNETETTTAKIDAGSSGAETSRVETIHLHGQETQPISKSYSYSKNGASYLEQEPVYSNQPNDDQSYEYGKRVQGSQYKGSPSDAYNLSPSLYNLPQQEIHHTDYIDSFENYGQRHIDSHEPSGGKGNSYSQIVKQEDYEQNYGKDVSAYAQGHSSGGDKQAVYAYEVPKTQQQEYAYEVPKTQQQEYATDDVYNTKSYGSQSDYGVEDTKALQPKGYEDTSYYNVGSKGYNFPPKQSSIKTTDYTSGVGDHSSGGKSSSGGSSYPSGGSGYLSGGSAYSSGGKSNNFPVYPKEAGYISSGSKEPSYLHSSSKGSDYQKEAGYHPSGLSKGSDFSSILHQGQSGGGSNHGKVSVFIKQLGHSQDGNKYGIQNGEQHGYLLLPVVPGKESDKVNIETTGSYGGSEYKGAGQDGHGSGYARRPVHSTGVKPSFTSYFKTGVAAFGGNSKSGYNGGDFGLGGISYGGESKSGYNKGGDYGLGGISESAGQKFTPIGQNAYPVSGHSSYETHSESHKGTPYGKEYPSQDSQAYSNKGSSYESGHNTEYSALNQGGHGILSENVKYVPSQGYQKQQSHGNQDISSYGISSQPKQHSGKGTPYVKEQTYQFQNSHAPSPKGSQGYEQGQHVQTSSYGHGTGPVIIPDKVQYVSQSHQYENQQSYGAQDASPYGYTTSPKQLNAKGTDFQPTNYGSLLPAINPHASVVDFSNYGGGRNKKVASSSQGHGESYRSGHQSAAYGQSKGNASHKKPKSIALILQRPQGGQSHSEGYGSSSFPVRSESTSKSLSHGYSSQGFQPIIPKHGKGGPGGASLFYNLQSFQGSPSFPSIDHTKGSSRYY